MTTSPGPGRPPTGGEEGPAAAGGARSREHAPWALTTHDLAWGALVAVLSVGMFVVTPLLAVLRRMGVIDWPMGWVFLPAILCVLAVFLHGVSELVRSLMQGHHRRDD
jgi:TRAP-type C4-dicarboxylate transport system permease small subunit